LNDLFLAQKRSNPNTDARLFYKNRQVWKTSPKQPL